MSNSIEELIKKLTEVGGVIEEGLKIGLGQALLKIQADAKKNCPVETGQLRNSILVNTKYEGSDIIGEVGTSVEHGIYTELGTGKVGELSPKVAPLELIPKLKYRQTPWVYYKKEQFIETRGQKAKPYLYPALKNNEKNIEKYIERGVNTYTKRLSKD